MIVLVLVFWGYLTYERHQKIQNFFKDPNDLAWAQAYLNQKINFCDEPGWEETVLRRGQGKDGFFSPSGRYELIPNGRGDEKSSFKVIDHKYDQISANIIFEYDEFIYPDYKWVKDEHFLIFRSSRDRDDWRSSDVFIHDLSTKKVIYLGESLSCLYGI
jgi:hypothetical protein